MWSRPEKLLGIRKRKKCGHHPGEGSFGERAKVIKEDFEEEPSAKYILLSNAFGVELFLLSVLF